MDVIYRYDPYLPMERRVMPDSQAALDALRDGNARFADFAERLQSRMLGGDPGEPIVIPISPISMGLPLLPGTEPKQSPFAMMLGCSDARVPLETIFDQSFNDLFVLRIAGNALGSEGLGSVHYAVRNLSHSLKLLAVLGHTGCGAVAAAVDAYLSPETYVDIAFSPALRSVVDHVQVAIRGASRALFRTFGNTVGGRPGYREALIDMAVYLNAAVTSLDLQREVKQLGSEDLLVVYGVYDLGQMRVRSLPPLEDESRGLVVPVLAPAPTSAAELVILADRLASSVAQRGILG